jgi:hypothetical protein
VLWQAEQAAKAALPLLIGSALAKITVCQEKM